MTLQNMQLSNCQISEETSLRGHVGALSSTSSLSLSRVCALLFHKHVTQRPCRRFHTPSFSLAKRNPLLHPPVSQSSGVTAVRRCVCRVRGRVHERRRGLTLAQRPLQSAHRTPHVTPRRLPL